MTCAPIRIGLFNITTSMRISCSSNTHIILTFPHKYSTLRERDANLTQSKGHYILVPRIFIPPAIWSLRQTQGLAPGPHCHIL